MKRSFLRTGFEPPFKQASSRQAIAQLSVLRKFEYELCIAPEGTASDAQHYPDVCPKMVLQRIVWAHASKTRQRVSVFGMASPYLQASNLFSSTFESRRPLDNPCGVALVRPTQILQVLLPMTLAKRIHDTRTRRCCTFESACRLCNLDLRSARIVEELVGSLLSNTTALNFRGMDSCLQQVGLRVKAPCLLPAGEIAVALHPSLRAFLSSISGSLENVIHRASTVSTTTAGQTKPNLWQ